MADRNADLDQQSKNNNFAGSAYGYAKCWLLAQKERDLCWINPDNFAVFAQMSLADKKTKWGAPSNFVRP